MFSSEGIELKAVSRQHEVATEWFKCIRSSRLNRVSYGYDRRFKDRMAGRAFDDGGGAVRGPGLYSTRYIRLSGRTYKKYVHTNFPFPFWANREPRPPTILVLVAAVWLFLG